MSKVHFLHIAFFFDFALLDNALDMLRDHRSFFREQKGHLFLATPDRVFLRRNVDVKGNPTTLKTHNLKMCFVHWIMPPLTHRQIKGKRAPSKLALSILSKEKIGNSENQSFTTL